MNALKILSVLLVGAILNKECNPELQNVNNKTDKELPEIVGVQGESGGEPYDNDEEDRKDLGTSGEDSTKDQKAAGARLKESQESQKESSEFKVNEAEEDMARGRVPSKASEETEIAKTKTNLPEDEKTTQDIQKFQTAFTRVLTETLLLAISEQSPVLGIVTSILLDSSGMTGNGDLWKQLQGRIKVEVGKGLAEYHFHQNKKYRMIIEEAIKKEERLTAEDWDDKIAEDKFEFFPQNNPATGYDNRLCLLPTAWVTYMVAALGQLENQNKVPRCSVAKELKKVKEDVRMAAKEMFRKRYSAMDGTGYFTRGSSCSGRGSCQDTRTWNYRLVDGTTDETFVVQKTAKGSPSWNEFNKFKEETLNVVWDTMVSKINDFFKADICREGCECPAPLRKDEVTWSYTSGCFGKLGDKKYCNQCDVPCMHYGESYRWCGCTGNDIRKDWTWDYCGQGNWYVCLGETPYDFLPATKFHDSRDKKKKKMMKKGKKHD